MKLWVCLPSLVVALLSACSDNTAPSPTQPTSPETGAFVLGITGALSGIAVLNALPIIDSLSAHGNFIGMSPPSVGGIYVINVTKAVSSFAPAPSFDQTLIAINPSITAPGVYLNDSCSSGAEAHTVCAGLTYSIGNGRDTNAPASASVLTTLVDARDSITVDEITPTRVRMSIVGPLLWTHPGPNGPLADTVMARATVTAYAAHQANETAGQP